MDNERTDEILGITRCARCGHRLEGEIECPFCSLFPEAEIKKRVPKWVYMTACFLTSPISLFAIIKTDRLNSTEKVIVASGGLMWLVLYRFWL